MISYQPAVLSGQSPDWQLNHLHLLFDHSMKGKKIDGFHRPSLYRSIRIRVESFTTNHASGEKGFEQAVRQSSHRYTVADLHLVKRQQLHICRDLCRRVQLMHHPHRGFRGPRGIAL